MSTHLLDPVDTCGCGDIGYLTTRNVPIDLAHGAGTVTKVPVYHCQNSNCDKYTVPYPVAKRLEDIAEIMEKEHLSEIDFSWANESDEDEADSSSGQDFQTQTQTIERIVQAFTLQLANREYEDSKVIFVIPGQGALFQSLIDHTEYYSLIHEPTYSPESVWFTFSKFYSDYPIESIDDFIDIQEKGGLKELAVLRLEEIEDALIDEFGEIVS